MLIKCFAVVLSVGFFTYLLHLGLVSDTVYLGLLSLTLFTSIIVIGFDRLREIDLKSLKLVLSDIKEESKELKELAFNLSELIAMNSAFQGRWGSYEWNEPRDEIQRMQIEKILKNKNLTNCVFRYQNIFKKIDEIEKNGKGDAEADRILNTLEQHLADLKKNKIC